MTKTCEQGVHRSDGIVLGIQDIAGFVSEIVHCLDCGVEFLHPIRRPFPISSGSWRVLRDATTDPSGPRIVHAENLTKEFAQRVARNWRAYNATIEEMEPVTT